MAATLKDIMAFFGATLSAFSKEWKELTETERTQIRTGIENGSLNY